MELRIKCSKMEVLCLVDESPLSEVKMSVARECHVTQVVIFSSRDSSDCF